MTTTTPAALDNISSKSNPATSSLTKPTNDSTTGTTSSGSLGLDETTFLKLLTTQLKNQDPTNPTDTTQFTQQIATLSQVEQQTNSNTKLDKIITLLGGNNAALSAQLNSASNYIGKTVQVPGDTFVVNDNGDIKLSYTVPKGTSNSTITITDSKGKTIGSFAGKNTEGKQNVIWDATDAKGNRVPSGSYKVSVKLLDASSKTTAAATYVYEKVDSVEMDSGKANVVLDQGQISGLDSIISVEQ